MENIRHLLEAREEQLMKIKKEKEISLASAPEGTLRVCSHGNRMQYFLRNDPKDFSGRYLGKKTGILHKRWHKKTMMKKY